MIVLNLSRCALSVCAPAILLSGCGGPQGLIGQAPGPGVAPSASHGAPARAKACPTSTCIYVVNQFNATVTVYPANASGNVNPYRTITMDTGGSLPDGIAIDRRGRTYVSLEDSTIQVYAALANGNAKPLYTITGPKTHLSSPADIALDAGDDIYALNAPNAPGVINYVTVYAAKARGDSSPIQTIKGRRTEMHPVERGITADSLGNTYVTRDLNYFKQPKGKNEILTYAAGATGNVAPIRTIHGWNTDLSTPLYIAVDADGNVYVTDDGGGIGSVKVFAAGAHGNVAPIRMIFGSQTGICIPYGISVDTENRVYVANTSCGSSSITVYSAGANGNVAPIQTITGSNTGLDHPMTIAVH